MIPSGRKNSVSPAEEATIAFCPLCQFADIPLHTLHGTAVHQPYAKFINTSTQWQIIYHGDVL